MTASKTMKTHCPTCDGDRMCDLHGETSTKWEWETPDGQHSVWGGADHQLLQCRGCETAFYRQSSWNSEDVDYSYGPDGETLAEAAQTITTYPKPESKTKPSWLTTIHAKDTQLSEILDEVYLAFDHDSFILTAVGLRTALDRAVELLGIDAAITFEEKLQELRTQGWIGDTEFAILEVVTEAGNAAAHRGWRPDASHTRDLLAAMEIFLQRAFVIEKKALKLKGAIPPKPSRRKPANAAAPAAVLAETQANEER